MGVPVEDMVAELRPYVSGAADFTIEDVLRRTMDEFYTESRSWLSVAHLEWPVPVTTPGVLLRGARTLRLAVRRRTDGSGSAVLARPRTWDDDLDETYPLPDVGDLDTTTAASFVAADYYTAPAGWTYDGLTYEYTWPEQRAPGTTTINYDPIPAPAADASGADISSSAAAFEAMWVAPLTGRSDTDPGCAGIPLTRTAGMDDLATRRARPRAAPTVFALSDGNLSMDPLPAEPMDFLVACALKPTPAATEIPDDAMGTSKTYIVEGALAYLCRMPNQAWTSQAASERYMHRFQNGIAEARAEVMVRWANSVRQPLAPFSFDGYRKP